MSLLKQTIKEMAVPLYCIIMTACGVFCILAPFANPWFFLATPPYILLNIFMLSREAAKEKMLEDGKK